LSLILKNKRQSCSKTRGILSAESLCEIAKGRGGGAEEESARFLTHSSRTLKTGVKANLGVSSQQFITARGGAQ
jgi:hypothetical protein